MFIDWHVDLPSSTSSFDVNPTKNINTVFSFLAWFDWHFETPPTITDHRFRLPPTKRASQSLDPLRFNDLGNYLQQPHIILVSYNQLPRCFPLLPLNSCD